MKYLVSSNALVAICLAAVLMLLLGLAQETRAQNTTDGSTPLGLAPGSPSGSYPLSDFESINLYNGGLNFSLPLLQIGGRGGAGYSIKLHIGQKWNVTRYFEPGTPAFYFPEPGWWSEDGGGWRTFDAGRVHIRLGGSKDFIYACGGYLNTKSLSRITFSAPDGTEYELRDQLTNGQPKAPVPCTSGFNRGKTFVTADGSSATFISDSDIIDPYWHGEQDVMPPAYGFLMLRDGTRFRIEDDKVTWMRDRNGNLVTFTYDVYKRVTSIKDSLNREVTVTYAAGAVSYDEITLKAVGGSSTRTIRIGQTGLSNALRSGFTQQSSSQLFPELSPTGNWGNPNVISYIQLPDGRQYQLQYNSYGELARVVLPTGGAIEYDYAAGLTDGYASGVFIGTNNKYIYRRVIERRVYPDGSSGSAYANRTTYSRPETKTANAGYVITEQFNSSGTLLLRSQHYFYGSPRVSFDQLPTDYPGWQDGREYQTDVFDSNGTTLLRRVNNTFAQRSGVSWWTGASDATPPNDPRLVETVTAIEPGGANRVSKQTFGYDDSVPFNNQNNIKEYDFGNGTPGALLRETRTTFITAANYTGASVHLRSLALQVSVYDGGGVERARTTNEYDTYTGASHALLVPRSSVTGLCNNSATDCPFASNFNSDGYLTRGNVTATTGYLFTNGSVTGSVSSYAQYDTLGNLVKTIDARGYVTEIDFSDRFGAADNEAQYDSGAPELAGNKSYAFATKVTNAAGHISYTQFDFYTGKPVNTEDVNGVVSRAYYNDLLGRPTQITRAVNTGLPAQTTFAYDDPNHLLTTTSDQTSYNDNVLKSQTVYDGLGRTTESRQYEGGSNYILTKQTYDVVGRPSQVSNPYRPWLSETAVWTTTSYDALSRVSSVVTPDGATVSTSYSGDSVTVTDQAGKARKSRSDALGRLIEVYENPATLNYLTSYSYDALGNLTTVTQGSQTRSFVYDSLKRLKSATNPESGTVSYTYDDNGNLGTKTDARGVVTTYAYDALNRAISRTYSDGTPAVSYTYDSTSITNGKGLPASVSSSVSSYAYSGYDVHGRALSATQTIGSQNYSMSQTYDLAGHVKTITYPSQHVVTYNYDEAGRLADKDGLNLAFTGNLGDGTQRNYASGISYASNGGWKREQFGTTTPLYNKRFYNNRQQLYGMFLSTVNDESNWNRGAIVNYYSLSNYGFGSTGTDTNGNLYVQQHWVPADDAVSSSTFMQQNYDYDALNRLTWVGEYANGAPATGGQSFGYDRYGNRTIASAWGTGINGKQFTVNATDNQLLVPSGQTGTMTYDSAGNLTTDTYSGWGVTRVYDAENRMLSETQAGSVVAGSYAYDADGHRVKRTVSGTTTWQVYGLGGELLAEYAANGSPSTPQKEYGYRNGELLITAEPNTANNAVQWLVSDQLGTPRMIADKTGSLAGIKRHDYLPFGEQLFAGSGNRSTGGGYSGDNVRQQFTSHERDLETGLNYMQARYFSCLAGRFVSADSVAGLTASPQSFNLYAYVTNNPLKFIDPTGNRLEDIGVYQTQNPQVARGLNYQTILNLRYEASQGQQNPSVPQNPSPAQPPTQACSEQDFNFVDGSGNYTARDLSGIAQTAVGEASNAFYPTEVEAVIGTIVNRQNLNIAAYPQRGDFAKGQAIISVPGNLRGGVLGEYDAHRFGSGIAKLNGAKVNGVLLANSYVCYQLTAAKDFAIRAGNMSPTQMRSLYPYTSNLGIGPRLPAGAKGVTTIGNTRFFVDRVVRWPF